MAGRRLDDPPTPSDARAGVSQPDGSTRRRGWRPAQQIRYEYLPALVVLAMVVFGLLGAQELADAAEVLWRPLVAITAIMVTAAAVERLGVLSRVSASLFPFAGGSRRRLFVLVFLLSGVTAAVLNNDAAVLLLVPVVVALARSLYPREPDMVVPFAFAVMMAAGVAPFVVSNPMNMIVAEYVGLDFNSYALRMVPISAVGWLVALLVMLRLFRSELSRPPAEEAPPAAQVWERHEILGVVLLLATFGAYPLVSYLGGPVHLVAATGAALAVLLCLRHRADRPWTVVRQGIAWEILVFLAGISVVAVGLRDVSLASTLARFYAETGEVGIGLVSAAGSALLNNHPMSLINMLALEAGSQDGLRPVLAALVGGDLGPRLLPWGSLAGLLWFASLRRLDVHVPVRRFVMVGAAITAATLPVSLLVLLLLP